ncbi:NACHT N-terminal Helical domain 1-containing protein [Streptomyces kronopolitis]|uniref:NACHT N-terminal Helical domain 1-containing protein n=1 Tax=Streptomyces kronopolitis TaxID=1612435 RepID=UPI003698C57C
MDPSVLGVRLASGVVAPLIRKLFVKEGPGAGLVAKPVRISGLVSFTGERRTLSDQDLHKIAADLVARAVRTAGPGERPVAADEEQAVARGPWPPHCAASAPSTWTTSRPSAWAPPPSPHVWRRASPHRTAGRSTRHT